MTLSNEQTVESSRSRVSSLEALEARQARPGTTRRRSALVVVPIMLFTSSMLMALAWLGHLRFEHWPFVQALFACWLLVLPEYILNVSAIRYGHGTYTGGEMASFNLCSGVLCVALVARFVLGEEFTDRKLLGFGIMLIAMVLIGSSGRGRTRPDEPEEGR